MQRWALSLAACGLVLIGTSACRADHIATIDGNYDTLDYDTPGLIFHNTSTYDFINAKVVLHGYQGLNNGVTQTVYLANMLAGVDSYLVWNSTYGASYI